jgi:sugar lactone lactonase YvrE
VITLANPENFTFAVDLEGNIYTSATLHRATHVSVLTAWRPDGTKIFSTTLSESDFAASQLSVSANGVWWLRRGVLSHFTPTGTNDRTIATPGCTGPIAAMPSRSAFAFGNSCARVFAR